LSFVAVFAESVPDVVPVFNVITSLVEQVIMFDVPLEKDLLLNGAKWRRDFRLKMKITGSFQFSVRSIKKMAGKITILVV
jgi:hypothetical protein